MASHRIRRVTPTLVVIAATIGMTPDVAHARRQAPLAEPAAAAALPTAPPDPPPASVPVVPAAESRSIEPTPPSVPPPIVSPAPAPNTPPSLRRKDGKGMMIAGLSTLGTAYIMSSLKGVMLIDKASKDRVDPSTGADIGPDRRGIAHGRALQVPVLGPFFALRHAPSATVRWLDVFSGSIQTAGLVLAVVGIAHFRRARLLRRYQLTGGVTHAGAVVGLSGHF